MSEPMNDTEQGRSPRPRRKVREKTKPLVLEKQKRVKKRKLSEYCVEPDEESADVGALVQHPYSESEDEIQVSGWIKTPTSLATRADQSSSRTGKYASESRNDHIFGRGDTQHTASRSTARPAVTSALNTVRATDNGIQPFTFAKSVHEIGESISDDDIASKDRPPPVNPQFQRVNTPSSEARSSSPAKSRKMKHVLPDTSPARSKSHDVREPIKQRISSNVTKQQNGPTNDLMKQRLTPHKGPLSEDNSPFIVHITDPVVKSTGTAVPSHMPSTPTKGRIAHKQQVKKLSSHIPLLVVQRKYVEILKHHIMCKLINKSAPALRFRDRQYVDVHTLLRETIIRAESNSALLLGPEATGKTILVESALQSFKDAGNEFLVVRLDGNIQTDDRQALRAIAKQLQPDNEEIAKTDIMSALLAILAHPRDYGETEDPLSTIILLDNFEQFTEHPRQTLLYNLFDIAQSKKAPICVLGLTSRVNSYDALEKRVKSRFSHRVIQFPHLDEDQFKDLAKSFLSSSLASADAEFTTYQHTWHEYIATSEHLDAFLQFTYLTTTNIRDICTALVPRIAHLGTSELYFAFPDFSALLPTRVATSHLLPDSKLSILPTLSLLELAMLISAARLEIKGGRINLMTTIDEHTSLVQKSSIAQKSQGVTTLRSASSGLCSIAWQKLHEMSLIVLQTGRLGGDNSDFRVCKVEVRLEEISAMAKTGKLRIAPWMNSWLSL